MFTFTCDDLLEKNLRRNADRIAIVSGAQKVTYGDLSSQVNGVAQWLAASGLRRRDRVAIHLPKSVEEVVATFAIARQGGVFVNVNYQWTIQQLRYVVQDCGVRFLITDRRRAALVEETGLIDELEQVLVRGEAPDHPKCASWRELDAKAEVKPPRKVDTDLAALLYTSGSTGQPKGVMLTHLNIIQGARSVACYLQNTEDDRTLGLLPMSFDYGMSQVTTMFLVGGSVALQPVIMPAEIVKTVIAQEVTGMAAVPPAWIQIVRYLQSQPQQFPALRYITNSGGKIPPSILNVMPGVFPGVEIFLMYGLTEAFRSCFLPPSLYEQKRGAIGQAIPNVEVFVVHPEKGICGPNEEGELIHRGSLIGLGYWGKEEATSEKIKVCEHLRPLLGDERVLYSGDLVRMDEDGVLWFVSRADSMIKSSGFRISPTEVEDVAYQSGIVADAVAFGFEDEELGEAVVLCVSLDEAASVDALSAFCRKNMPNYMTPKHYLSHGGAMPRTSSGKIDRPAVIRWCLDNPPLKKK